MEWLPSSLTLTVPTTPILTISIGSRDLNAIKRIFELANSLNSTYIAVEEDVVQDMVELLTVPITSGQALRVDSYVSDTTGPRLLSFTLNLTSEFLILTFDETVNVDSFDITQLVFHSGSNVSYSTYQFPD